MWFVFLALRVTLLRNKSFSSQKPVELIIESLVVISNSIQSPRRHNGHVVL